MYFLLNNGDFPASYVIVLPEGTRKVQGIHNVRVSAGCENHIRNFYGSIGSLLVSGESESQVSRVFELSMITTKNTSLIDSFDSPLTEVFVDFVALLMVQQISGKATSVEGMIGILTSFIQWYGVC